MNFVVVNIAFAIVLGHLINKRADFSLVLTGLIFIFVTGARSLSNLKISNLYLTNGPYSSFSIFCLKTTLVDSFRIMNAMNLRLNSWMQ